VYGERSGPLTLLNATERLDPRARTLWRIGGITTATIMALIAAGLAAGAVWLDLLPMIAAIGLVALVVVVTGAVGWLVPEQRWRLWRYEIGEAEVDLQHGWLTRTRTLIPMARIQHVDTRRGPLQRRFGLASVVLYTAAGAREIPALADQVADATRDRIAALANVQDDL